MKFDMLTLKNFRQYYGKQKIAFSKSNENNITVIHGENGSGKTALLNSFLWLFYGKVNLPDPEKIVNERVITEIKAGGKAEVIVTLTFEHDGKKYTAWRKQVVRKWSDAGSKKEKTNNVENIEDDFQLNYIDTAGKTITPGNPQNVINQIIPFRLSSLFFFHGEDIDRLSKEESSEEIQKDIRNIMGLTILERSILHLGKVAKRFEKEMEKYGSEELKDFIEEKKRLEKEYCELKNERNTLNENLEALRDEKREVDEKFKRLENTKKRAEKRERLESELKDTKSSINEINEQIKILCSKKAYLTLVDKPYRVTQKILEEERERGNLPTSIKRQLVDDLLKIHMCICGRELNEGTEPFKMVKKWREKAGSKGLEGRAAVIASAIKEFPQKRKEFNRELKKNLKQKNNLLDRKKELEEQISEIGKGFEKDVEEIKELENKRKKIGEDIDKTNKKLGSNENEIKNKTKNIKNHEEKIEKTKIKQAKGLIAQKRFIVCKKAQEYLEKQFSSFSRRVRDNVQEKVGNLYSEFVHKPYRAHITDDYELKILKKVGSYNQPVGMSTGERQIASLAFIGGLVDIARERYKEEKDAAYFKGGLYPIIMDSPFGYLDKDYRKAVSENIPKLAEQVIVLVTDTQWEGDVEEAMKGRAGKIYQLKYNDPRTNPEIEHEYTKIIEVKK